MRTIKGKWEKDSNFTTVYCDNAVYTISNVTGEWAACPVGSRTATGHILTQEIYDKWASECEKEGTFELS